MHDGYLSLTDIDIPTLITINIWQLKVRHARVLWLISVFPAFNCGSEICAMLHLLHDGILLTTLSLLLLSLILEFEGRYVLGDMCFNDISRVKHHVISKYFD